MNVANVYDIRSSPPLSRQPDANDPAVYRGMNVFSQITYFHPEAFFLIQDGCLLPCRRRVVGTVSDLQAPASLRPHRFCCCEEAFVFGVASLLVRVSCRSVCLSLSRMCVLSRVLANSSEPVIVAYGGRLCFFSLLFMCTTA